MKVHLLLRIPGEVWGGNYKVHSIDRTKALLLGGRWEGGSGLETHVHLWWIHVNVWQNQHSILKQNKIFKKNFKKNEYSIIISLPYSRLLFLPLVTDIKNYDL